MAALVGRKDQNTEHLAKQREMLGLFRTFDSRVQAMLSVSTPPEMADRLECLVAAVPGISKRDVVLTGIQSMLEACERAPDDVLQILKVGAFKSRGKVTFGVSVPMDLDERLGSLVKTRDRLSRRDVALAGIDFVISKCEQINGGPFSPVRDFAKER